MAKLCYKKCFATRQDAKNSRRLANKVYGVGLTSIYYCRACSSYHLTSMPKSSRAEMRRKNKRK